MTDKQPTNTNWLKGIAIAVAIVAGVYVGGAWLAQSDWLFKTIEEKIEETASQILDAEVQIEEVTGEIFSQLSIQGLSWKKAENDVKIAEILIDYSIKELLFGDVNIRGIYVDSVLAKFNNPNFEELIPSNEEESTTTFVVDIFSISDLRTEYRDEEFFKDTALIVDNFQLATSLQVGETNAITIQDISFAIESGKLPGNLLVGLQGAADDNTIQLNDIILKVGETILNGSVEANLSNENVNSRFAGTPVYQKTITTWTNQELNADDIDLQLSLEGNFSEFEVTVHLDSDNIEQGKISASVVSEPEWTVNALEVNASYLNFDQVLNDSTYIATGPFSFQWNGEIRPASKEYSGTWEGELSNPRYNEYQLTAIRWNGSIDDGEVETQFSAKTQSNERLYVEGNITGLFEEIPNWEVEYELVEINPRRWTQNESLSGLFTLSGTVKGFGWAIPDSGWTYSLANKRLDEDELIPIQLFDEEFDALRLSGEFGELKTYADFFAKKQENEVVADFQATNIFSEIPEYSYQLEFDSINAGSFKPLEGNTTNINGSFYGIGNGKSLETMNLFGTLSITDSEINEARLDTFKSSINLDEGILILKEGTIDSEIASGKIRGQRNLFDLTDPNNRLSLNLDVLNTQPLAGFLGLQTLQATGKLTGEITQAENQGLEGIFDLGLNNVMVDSMFSAISVNGEASLRFAETIGFDGGFNIKEPSLQEVVLQDIMMYVNGFTTSDSLTADLSITITGSERGRLEQKANFTKDLNKMLMDVRFTQFDFITSGSNLVLQQPYNVRVTEEGFGTDTLILSSQTGAYFEFSIPYLSELDKEVHLNGTNFDLGLIQEIVLGERFLDGLLSGQIQYSQDGELTSGKGNAIISNINYNETTADSLVTNFEISEERLQLETRLSWDNQVMLTGSADVPFVINADSLDDEFYRRSVSGSLSLKPTNLAKFKQLLAEAGIENTTGIASFNSSMRGTAGSPTFTGQLTIDEPVLSGIPINTITSEFTYSAERQSLDVQSEIFAANTSAAEITIEYPFAIDFRTYEFKLPGDEDNLAIQAVSNKLNLALFDDFIDPNYVKGLKGELNADIAFTGTVGEIKPDGFVNVKNASFDVPFTGIKLRNINSEINVNPEKLTINRIYAESGRGRFAANGSAALDGLSPSDIDIKTNARLFEISNTRDMKLAIDLDAAMKGELLQPELSGNLVVNSGYYYLSNFGEEAIEEVELEDEGIDSFAPFDSLKIDMNLELRRDFFVRSRDYLDLELEPVGTLEIAKERDQEMRLFGSLNADQGYIRPLGKRFEIERGTFQFIGDYENPELDIRSAYVPQTRQKGESVVLYYVITGTADDPEFSFESEPEMEQSDVICYTLFNKPCYSLDSWQSVLAEGNDAMAFQALADVLLDQVETLATRELGVDVVQIDNSGQNGATAIRTGWYLNDRTFFSIINEITSSTPKTLFVLEYILNESWDLIITQGDDARQGIDVRYQYDY
jgi:hypothetical protein